MNKLNNLTIYYKKYENHIRDCVIFKHNKYFYYKIYSFDFYNIISSYYRNLYKNRKLVKNFDNVLESYFNKFRTIEEKFIIIETDGMTLFFENITVTNSKILRLTFSKKFKTVKFLVGNYDGIRI